MVRFSPGSYVFEGLQLIREPLLHFILENLENRSSDWWYRYCYRHLNENEHYRHKVIDSDGYWQLLDLDVLGGCIIIGENPGLFNKDIKDAICKLRGIRNDYCHADEYFITGKREADKALSELAKIMEKIDTECSKKLSSLRKDFAEQIYNTKKIVASKDDLVYFLYKNIWAPSFKTMDELQTVDAGKRKKLERLREKMLSAHREVLGFQTAEEVELWFVNNLYDDKGVEMVDELKSISDIRFPTFEDNRKAFKRLCYGEQQVNNNTGTKRSS